MYLILVLKYYWMYKKKSMHFARVFFKYSMQDNFFKLFPNLVLMKVLMALTLKLISSIEMFHHTSRKDTSFFEKRYLRRSPYWLICIWVMEYDWVYKKESQWRFFGIDDVLLLIFSEYLLNETSWSPSVIQLPS